MLNLGVGVDLSGTLEVSQSALGIAAHQGISTWLQLAARSIAVQPERNMARGKR